MRSTITKLFLLGFLAAGLIGFQRPMSLAETFTEGVRVPPETVTLKPGEYFTDRAVDPTTQSAPGFQILVAQKDKPS